MLALQASRDLGKHPVWHGCLRPANVDGDGNLLLGSGNDTRASVEGELARSTSHLCFRMNVAQRLFMTPCSPLPGQSQREQPQAHLPHSPMGRARPPLKCVYCFLILFRMTRDFIQICLR